jgi:bacillithiol system protein YtxJ
MQWKDLTDDNQLSTIKEESHRQPVVIFKHSTKCPTSSMAKHRMEKSKAPESVSFYYLDLLRYRSVSNKVAELFHVHHESPQVLLIKNGECVYTESHIGINMQDIEEQAVTA